MNSYLLVNFGGPRTLEEVSPFLIELLCDRDLIRTRFPSFFHNWFFTRVARKRAERIRHDYQEIGGCSPIYSDTEILAERLSKRLGAPVWTFHRYLPMTHAASLRKIAPASEVKVLPLFPQFCYATTGSVARFFSAHFPHKLLWIRSYANHPGFIRSYQTRIAAFLHAHRLTEAETILLFSAHGVPRSFIDEGDPYEAECQASFRAVMQAFPRALGHLAYQSKFGRGEWLRPYTNETCEQILKWHQGRKNVVFVPISFTSDHIETLFEIEKLYLPLVAERGLNAFRCPALNTEEYWIEALAEIFQGQTLHENQNLIRRSR